MNSSVLDIIKKRRSLRDCSSKDIEEEKIRLILESARLAPSSCNSQPWHFIIVRDKETIQEISKSVPVGENIIGYYSSNAFISKAPVIVIACANPNPVTHSAAKLIGIDCLMLDMGIAIEHMVLTATELGLGTCWLGYFSDKKLRKLLKVPRGTKIAALLSVGYPAENWSPEEMKRKTIKEISSEETYGK